MVVRFFVAFGLMVFVLPFLVMFTFTLTFPEAQFAWDRATWLQGLAIIAFGWVVFLLPGLLPFVGHRYYDWVAEKTGLMALCRQSRAGYRGIRDRVKRVTMSMRQKVTGITEATRRVRPLRPKSGASSVSPAKSVKLGADQLTHQKDVIRDQASKQIDRARLALNDAPKHLEKAKSALNTLIVRFTPDELQRTIDLNEYTLEILSHLKRSLQALANSARLEEEDRSFVNSVLDAIPEPPSPGDPVLADGARTFHYPPERWPALRAAAARKRIALRDSDFELAAQGDLERALFIVSGMVTSGSGETAVALDSLDDPMIGLSPAPMGA